MTRADRAGPARDKAGRAAALAAAALPLFAAPALGYSAAGDRIFAATLAVPQIAPTDELYFRTSTLPLARSLAPSGSTRATNLTATYAKTITERVGLMFEGGYNWLDRDGASTLTGFQNPEVTLRYLAVLDPANEFLLTLGVNREFGEGSRRIGSDPNGATAPTVYFGKGFGAAGIEHLRPLGVKGVLGYQISDGGTRPDRYVAGLALEYSMPYLGSKVGAPALPDILQNLTFQVELLATTPVRGRSGSGTTAAVAPGISYAGQGWELGLSALVPVTDTTGGGAGVIAQFHLALDYLFPQTIGAPLLGR